MAGSLVEIRSEVLSFTLEEVRAAVAPAVAAQAAAMFARTQGWPAGVRLAELTLLADPTHTLPGHPMDGASVGYLFGESFVRQPPEVQDVLLAVADVDPLGADLAVRLTGRADAGAILRTVTRQGSLIAQSWDADTGQVRFHVHPLLRSYLSAEARLRDPVAAGRRRAVAAAWCLEHGELLAAATHARASGDRAVLDDILASAGLPLLLAGAGWQLDRLLSTDCPAAGWACVLRAVLALQDHRPGDARRWVQQADGLAEIPGRRLTAAIVLLAAHLARLEGAAPAPAVRPVTADLVDLCVLLDTARSAELLRSGRLNEAAADLREYVAVAPRPDQELRSRSAATHLAVAELTRGALPAMRLAATRAVGRSAGAGAAAGGSLGCGPDAVVATALIALADHRGLRPPVVHPGPALGSGGGSGGARSGLLRALEQFLPPPVDGSAPARSDGVTDFLARWLAGDGEPSSVGDGEPSSVEAGEPSSVEAGGVDDVVVRAFGPATARLALAAHRRDVLAAVRKRTQSLPGANAPAVALLDAWEAVADGAPRRALAILHRISADDDPETANLQVRQEVSLVIARCSFALGESADGTRALHAALQTARCSGDLRLFTECGAVIGEELSAHRDRYAADDDLVGRVLAARPAVDVDPPVLLTPRELELLAELASLDTLQDIAAGLHVSVNTIKTHLKGIYRKLDATSRREAVLEARAVGLL